MSNISSKIPLDEQETIIHYDYKENTFHLYTTRPSCYRKLLKVIGKPHKGDILGADWYFSFNDRETIRKCSTISILLTRKNSK